MSEKLNGLSVNEANSVIEWLKVSINGFVAQQKYSNIHFHKMKEWVLSPKMPERELNL